MDCFQKGAMQVLLLDNHTKAKNDIIDYLITPKKSVGKVTLDDNE